MSTRTMRSLTLEDPALLRATPVGQVLRNCGRILAKSDGDAATFKLSTQVQSIDAFISHNWSTPRYQKWMVLATHFNLRLACIVAISVMLILFVLQVSGIIPEVRLQKNGTMTSTTGCTCMFSGCLIYVLVLFFGRSMTGLNWLNWGSPSDRVFLDKTCIHQTDAALKEKGIKSLAAQMNNSKTVVVVYTDTYLRKVWTVYELASALILWPKVKVVVLPLFLPKLVIAGALLGPMRFAALLLIKSDVSGEVGKILGAWGFEIAMLPVYCFTVVILRSWGKERRNINHAVRSFDVRTAACFVESDRQLVQGNIIQFMRDFHFVGSLASDTEVLVAFNDLVHKRIPSAMVASLGRTGIPCLFLTSLLMSSVGRALDTSSAMLHDRAPLCQVLPQCVSVVALYSAIIPTSIAVMSYLLAHFKRLPCWAEKLYMLFIMLLGAGVTAGVKKVFMFLMKKTCTSAWHCVGFTSAILLAFAVTFLLYRSPETKYSRSCFCSCYTCEHAAKAEATDDSDLSADSGDRQRVRSYQSPMQATDDSDFSVDSECGPLDSSPGESDDTVEDLDPEHP